MRIIMKRRFRGWSIVLSAGLLITLASVGVVACGSKGLTQSNTSSTPVQANIQKCGNVFGYGHLEPVPQDMGSEQAENCFWQAFQHCQPATLVFTTQSTDRLSMTITHTFTIRNNSAKCSLSDTKQQRTNPISPAQVTIYACTGLAQSPRALDVLSCGQEGTVHVQGA